MELIIAAGESGQIGSDEGLPWNFIKDDMEYFKNKTLNKTVIMGRKTFDSIGKKLKNRKNIVITNKKQNYKNENDLFFYDNIEKAIIENINDKIIVIGGKEIYLQTLKYVNKLYINIISDLLVNKNVSVHIDIEKDLNLNNFELTSRFVLNENVVSYVYEKKSKSDKIYLDCVKDILKNGQKNIDRTGEGTISSFAKKMEFDLQYEFPLITTKKVWWKGIVEELLWILRGETNIESLKNKKVNIWNEWADEKGNLGPIYGKQWRNWEGIDQIKNVIDSIKNNPTSRRHIVNAWNVAEIDKMSLPPCHMFFQFYVRENQYLDCQLYQRSGDMFLGIPFNIGSYSLLTHIIAKLTGLTPGKFIHIIGDAHIYNNHIEKFKIQLKRKPLNSCFLLLDEIKSIDDLKFENFHLIDYNSHEKIKAKVAV